jgi:chemotaxis protein CheC
MENIILSNMQKDALQELANIGAGHASTALSQMIGRSIRMGIPHVEIIPLEEILTLVKDEKVAVGVFLRISEQIPSYVLLMIPRDSAFALADMLMGRTSGNMEEGKVLSEMDRSALAEVSNVMVCAFFDSISELLQMTIIPGPPHLAFDIPEAVLDYVLIQIGAVSNDIVCFNVDLTEEQKESLKIHMFLMPEPQSIDTLLEKMGISSMENQTSSEG